MTHAARSETTPLARTGIGPRSGATDNNRARAAVFATLSREFRCALDDAGRFLLVEGAWQPVLGWDPNELHGCHWSGIVHPADHERVGRALDRLRAKSGHTQQLDVRLAVRGGGHAVIAWTLAPGAGADAVLGIGYDRSAERTAEARGRRASTRLEYRNRALAARIDQLEERYDEVERFAGMAAHQLAEPLVIAESSAILVAEELGDDLDPQLRERLDAIGRGAARARRLMDALLADARSAGENPSPEPVDLAEVVQATLDSLQGEIDAREARVVVEPLPHVLGEWGLLSVTVENLVSNALKYGPRTSGKIIIASQPCEAGFRVSVTSEGTPIPAGQAERIFEPFHRIPGERRVPGVGLGLAICARLVARMGGAIGVEPDASNGNTFWITLRAAP